MRRAEMARRRRNLSEKRNEEVKVSGMLESPWRVISSWLLLQRFSNANKSI
jgi:hypothetical protein